MSVMVGCLTCRIRTSSNSERPTPKGTSERFVERSSSRSGMSPAMRRSCSGPINCSSRNPRPTQRANSGGSHSISRKTTATFLKSTENGETVPSIAWTRFTRSEKGLRLQSAKRTTATKRVSFRRDWERFLSAIKANPSGSVARAARQRSMRNPRNGLRNGKKRRSRWGNESIREEASDTARSRSCGKWVCRRTARSDAGRIRSGGFQPPQSSSSKTRNRIQINHIKTTARSWTPGTLHCRGA